MARLVLHRVPTKSSCMGAPCATPPFPTLDFACCTAPTHHPTHAKSAKNTVPIATPTITPTLHPIYTHFTPTLHPWGISVCPENVCKIVCVARMYVDWYVIQPTVFLLAPTQHPRYTRPYTHPLIPWNTHTYTRGISQIRVLPIPVRVRGSVARNSDLQV